MPGKIHVPIAVNVQGMDKVTKAMGSLTKGIGRATAAFAALSSAGTIKFGGEAIQGARDLERNLAGLETVFGRNTQQMIDFGKGASDMGLSLSEAAKASTFIGSVLKQSGFDMQTTADVTQQLVTLGSDLALTYGYDVQEALLGMTALFRGEYDPIEKFGVAMKQSEIDAVKAARGLDHLTGASERFADQQIRLELLLDRASDSMGAVERNANSLAVQQNKLNATFSNMRDIAGMQLIPIVADFMGQLSDILLKLTPMLRDTFVMLEEPLSRMVDALLPQIENMLIGFLNFLQDLATIMNLATDPTSELGNKLQEAGNAINYLFSMFEDMGIKAPSFFEAVTTSVGFLADAIKNVTFFVQDAFWFIQAFAEALGKVSIWDLMFGTDADRRRFSDYISSAMYSKTRMRDLTLEELNAQQDAQFKQERFLRNQNKAFQEFFETVQGYQLLGKDTSKELVDDFKDELGKTGGLDIDITISWEKAVEDFFANLQEEIDKQGARFQLRGMGLSDALIESIVGSGEHWRAVFETIKNGGSEALDLLKNKFMSTSAGLAEYEQNVADLNEELDRQAELEQEIADINAELADTTAEISKEFANFREQISDLTGGIDALKTYEREIGRFEGQANKILQDVEDSIKGAFDNEMILEEARDNLSKFAKDELTALISLQRNRDQLFAQREAAAETIFGVAQAVAASGSLLSALGQIERKTNEIEITEVIDGVAKSADGLRDFKTSLTRNFIEVVEEVVDESKALTSNFQSVIDKTRLFIDNLYTLRELGLDPFLFNQLVEAGADAGGATAQALVDGGAETVDEINKLQGELNAMGVELGELTYDVMKDQGEQFVSGIIDGLDDQLADLESQASSMAQSFADAFAAAFNTAIGAMELNQIEVATEEATNAINEATEKVKPVIDEAAAEQLQALIDGANKYAANVSDLTLAAGAGAKAAIYQGLLDDVMAGRSVDLSGIEKGMSTSELAQAALDARQPGSSFNLTVNAGLGADGTQIGQLIVDEIIRYERSSGRVFERSN